MTKRYETYRAAHNARRRLFALTVATASPSERAGIANAIYDMERSIKRAERVRMEWSLARGPRTDTKGARRP